MRSACPPFRLLALAAALAAGPALANDGAPGVLRTLQGPVTGAAGPQLNLSGVPGAIDTPVATQLPDGEVATTVGNFAGITRTTLTFQITPRLSGSFRYSALRNWNRVEPSPFDTFFDRSFDLRYRVLDEGRYTPSLTVGLQDFVGTGIFSGEYVVATKTLGAVTVSGGLGWGRFGSYNSIGSTGTRPAIDIGQGGNFNADQWFRGPVAPFASVAWQATDRLRLVAEYASDAYEEEAGLRQLFTRRSPLNFGADYRLSDQVSVGAYSLYGSELGLRATVQLNPARPPNPGTLEAAPVPVRVRPARAADPAAWDKAWVTQDGAKAILEKRVGARLAAADLAYDSLALTATTAELRLRNGTYDAASQAIGRAARALSRALPASVEIFRIVPVSATGVAQSAVTLRRTDLEQLETAPDGAATLLARSEITDAARPIPATLTLDGTRKRFSWSLGPYVRTSYFDPSAPVRTELGARLRARFEPHPGLVFSGSLGQRITGNLEETPETDPSPLPRVRTDVNRYNAEGAFAIERLTAAYYFRPGADLYGRVTAGYLERMYGGLSGELLWKPVDSRLAFGVEVNYARQRDFDQLFGFQAYDVVTGHASAYLDLGQGFHAQLDVGRYLAGDVGATLSLEREFANGWRVGAFATRTDVSAEDFGEGSFDKGITLTVPVSYFTGKPSQTSLGTTIRPVQRDGGARLRVDGRLYDTVRGAHLQALEARWGRVLR